MTAQHDFPTAGVELRHLLVVSDYARQLSFYRDVLGATVVREFPGTLCLPPLWGQSDPAHGPRWPHTGQAHCDLCPARRRG
jgi:catechol 2,3-dioxygenase-like lactoylglutathione lyase family enzyme